MANGISSLLGNDAFNFGLGLLQASGPSTTPVSFGQALGQGAQFASTRQEQQLRNQVLRDNLAQQQQARQQQAQRQEAMQELSSLLTPTTQQETLVDQSRLGQASDPADLTRNVQGPAPINTAEGRQQAMSLLADASPNSLIQGVSSQLFAQPETPNLPTSIREFQAAFPNVDIGTSEGRTAFSQFQIDKDPMGALMDRLNITSLTQDIEEGQERREAEAEEREISASNFVGNVDAAFEVLESMGSANAALAGTLLETGQPLGEIAATAGSFSDAVGQLFGADTTDSRRLRQQRNTFEQQSNVLVNLLPEIMGEGEGGALTATQIRNIKAEKPNFTLDPATNALAIAGFADRIANTAANNAGRSPELAGIAERMALFAEQQRQVADQLVQSGSINGGGAVIDFNDYNPQGR